MYVYSPVPVRRNRSRGRDILGTSLLQVGAGAAGNAIAGPVGGAVAVASTNFLSNIFGGGSRDQQRKDRASWLLSATKQGSIYAGRCLLGGLGTVSNERGYYVDAVAQADVAAGNVMQAARQQGPVWDDSDAAVFGQSSMYLRSKQDIPNVSISLGSNIPDPAYIAARASEVAAQRAQGLPAMVTTESYNWTPVIVIGGIGLAALFLSRGGRSN